jgi:hypothetical protein
MFSNTYLYIVFDAGTIPSRQSSSTPSAPNTSAMLTALYALLPLLAGPSVSAAPLQAVSRRESGSYYDK